MARKNLKVVKIFALAVIIRFLAVALIHMVVVIVYRQGELALQARRRIPHIILPERDKLALALPKTLPVAVEAAALLCELALECFCGALG